MLRPDFKNGQKLDLQSALSLFVIMMGFLFLIDAAPGAHTVITVLMIALGFAWFFGHESVQRWWLKHHPHHPADPNVRPKIMRPRVTH